MPRSPIIRLVVPAVLLVVAAGAMAAEPPKRPDVGDYVPSYASTKCGGVDDGVPVGKTLCYTCRAGEEPIFYIFARRPSDPLARLVKQVETLVVARREQRAAAVVNFVGDPANERTRQEVVDFGAVQGLREVSLTITADGAKFGLDDEDEATVILFRNGVIRLRSSARIGALDDKAIESMVRRAKALLD